MVSLVSSTSLAQSMPTRVESRKAQEMAAASTAVATAAPAETSASTVTVPRAEAAAAGRVGEQLDAQFDASRLQMDVPAADGEAVTAATAGETEEADATEAAPAAAGGARMGGGAAPAAASSDSESTDYIAEADTNNDRKVSEEERSAYAKKQASETEKAAQATDAPAALSRTEEVQRVYLPQETAGTQLDISA